MTEYNHKEAFALMWYACSCGHRERIWNSRDGVTPFGGLLCVSCGGKGLDERRGLTHVDWRQDEPAPSHALQIGQLFFRDGTAGDAISIIKRRIRAFEAAGHPVPADVAEQLLNDARAQTGEWQLGWPIVDRWDEAKANHAAKATQSPGTIMTTHTAPDTAII